MKMRRVKKATKTGRGSIITVLPKEFCDKLNIQIGDDIEILFDDTKDYMLVRKKVENLDMDLTDPDVLNELFK
jgi:bifunctional DNA-binding transcriptional regulator/antitoxin component of YhaV-PrlF toxin-antitoxin module